MYLDIISWPDYVRLYGIQHLPISEQVKRYNYYLMEQEALINQVYVAQQAVGSGGTSPSVEPEPEPSVPSNCIQFTADTTIGGTTFEVFVTSTSATTATIDWGDGVIEDDVVIAGNNDTQLTHMYAEEDTAYNVTVCFADPLFITELDFPGDD
jgi:hypothetical protein